MTPHELQPGIGDKPLGIKEWEHVGRGQKVNLFTINTRKPIVHKFQVNV